MSRDDNRYPSHSSGSGQSGRKRTAAGSASNRGQAPREMRPARSVRAVKATQVANGVAIVAGLVAFAIFLAVFILRSATDLFGLNKEEGMVEITIPEDASTREIAKILKKNGIISQKLTFRLYSHMKDKDGLYNPGTYEMQTDWGYDQIMYALCKKEIETAVANLTFIEGMSAEEIAKALEEKQVCSAEDFLEAMDNNDFGYSFEETLPKSEDRYHQLEGYLFPDTYDFYVGEGAKSVVNRFLSNFNNKFTGDMYAQLEKSGMTLDEVMTMASIIQKEAGNPAEMKQVSGVFHNRLKSSAYPSLQSDTTTNYIGETFIEDYNKGDKLRDEENQHYIDAYNSFTVKGLPIGPICNPGIDAIKAALDPADHSYYFFVSDNAGKYYYARTFEEHQANIAKAAQINEQLSKEKD